MEQQQNLPYVPTRKPVPLQEFQSHTFAPYGEPDPKERLYTQGNSYKPHPAATESSPPGFFSRNRTWIIIAIAVTVVAIIAIGAGVGASKKHHSASGGSRGGDSSDCTPPGGMMCESSGDCQEISDFSQCLMACDGFSYCT